MKKLGRAIVAILLAILILVVIVSIVLFIYWIGFYHPIILGVSFCLLIIWAIASGIYAELDNN
jgi:hypothetical protein